MRLINTTTLRFREFFGSEIPLYAILSHRWQSAEVSYQDFMARGANDFDRPEYKKIVDCCAFAASQGYSWVWIDACCIDKQNSAELSEAINSMFRWYQKAAECYALLNNAETDRWNYDFGRADVVNQFRASEWWTRGWTLQELLAPHRLIFVDRNWKIMGEKDQLAKEISIVTGIPETYLRDPATIRDASVAARMSWASLRKTQRAEDRAYSLLGIFGINMPLLYGEGGRAAFRRLQLEILKISDDESIFVWKDRHRARAHPGLLAMWPEDFADSGDVIHHKFVADRPAYSMTHKGLKLRIPSRLERQPVGLIIPLNCRKGADPLPIGIFLHSPTPGHWNRSESHRLAIIQDGYVWDRSDCLSNKATIYVKDGDT